MIGAIRTRDILAHPVTTVRCFGWRVFIRSLLGGRRQTFLSLIGNELVGLGDASTDFERLIGRCVALERDAEEVYRALAERFGLETPGGSFFLLLADQEHAHAQLLEICALAARRTLLPPEALAPLDDAVGRAQRCLRLQRSAAEAVEQLDDALKVVLRIETSEINRLFAGVVASTESRFVERLAVFQEAGRRHVGFICREIERLDPGFQQACAALREAEPAPLSGCAE